MIARNMVVAIGVVLAGPGAHANTITQGFGIYRSDLVYNPGLDDPVYYSTDRFTFQDFDTSLGTLVGASLTYRGIVFPGLQVIGTPTEDPLPPLQETPNVHFNLDGASSPALAQGRSGALQTFTTELAYANAQGALTYTAAGEEFYISIPLDLTYLTDPGFTFNVGFGAGTQTGPLYGVIASDFEDGTALQSSITVTYEYSAVPEPSSLAVLAIPLALMGRKRRHSMTGAGNAAIGLQRDHPYLRAPTC